MDKAGLEARPLLPELAPRLFPHLADPRLYTFLPQDPPASPRALAEQFTRLAAGAPEGCGERWFNWALFAGDEPVGTLQATVQDDGVALIAYVVFAAAQGRGHATAACHWLVERLFEDESVQRVRALIDTRNLASVRVVEKVGLRRVATLLEADHFKGSASDEYVYERTRAEHGMDERLQTSVARHYGRGGLLDEILDALRAAGKDLDALTSADLAPVDAFHIRGREASMELAGHAALRPGERVLDVGCGIGGAVRFLATEQRCVATGLDLTPEYVRVAEALAQRVGLAEATGYRCGSALDLPFEDGSFDAVWTEHAQMNIGDKRGFYAEIARVVRPGGRLAFHDIFLGEGGDLLCPVPWAADPSQSFLELPETVRALLAELGFTVDVWRDRTAASRDFFEATLDRLRASGPPPVGIHLLMGETARAKLENCLLNLEQERIAVVLAVAVRQ
ncbi:MAG: GNAT family N-acetyltransferase [Planctomycetota bacterium]